MSRLFAYLGPPARLADLLVDARYASLPSLAESEEPSTRRSTSCGVGWFVPALARDPAVVRIGGSPVERASLRSILDVSASPCVLAGEIPLHSPAFVPEQPFRTGRLLFGHVGRVAGLPQVRRAFAASLSDEAFADVVPTSDSSWLRALYLDLWWTRREAEAHLRLAAALNELAWTVVATLQERAPGAGIRLNAVVTDGDHLVACRFAWSEETLPDPLFHTAEPIHRHAGRMPPSRRADERSMVTAVASDPVMNGTEWKAIRPAHMIVANRDVAPLHFEMRPRGLVPVTA